MRPMFTTLATIGLLQLGQQGAPGWEVFRRPGTGCWPPKCTERQLPLATPVIAFDGRLLMIGDGAAPTHVFESTDGTNWRMHTHDAGWGVRYQASDVVHAGAVWRVGGFVEDGGSRTPMNDVWRSVDGHHWSRVQSRASWPARSGAHLVSFRDTLWLLGGEPNDGAIWRSVDGIRWSRVASTTLPGLNPQRVVVHQDALWIVGLGAWNSASNDVWRSPDGVKWTLVSTLAGWSARTGAGIVTFGDRLWVVGGSGHRDVWSSPDGRTWRRSSDMPGPPRSAEYSAVFNGKYCVFGGKTGGQGGTGFWDGVACLTLQPSQP